MKMVYEQMGNIESMMQEQARGNDS